MNKKKYKGTHTIRWNGDKTSRIITFYPYFMEKLKTAKHDLVIKLILEKIRIQLESYTGKKYSFDHKQSQELTEYLQTINKNTKGYKHGLAQNFVCDGVKYGRLIDANELFNVLNVLFPLLQERMPSD